MVRQGVEFSLDLNPLFYANRTLLRIILMAVIPEAKAVLPYRVAHLDFATFRTALAVI